LERDPAALEAVLIGGSLEVRLDSGSLEILRLDNSDTGYLAAGVKKNKQDCYFNSIGLGLNICLLTF